MINSKNCILMNRVGMKVERFLISYLLDLLLYFYQFNRKFEFKYNFLNIVNVNRHKRQEILSFSSDKEGLNVTYCGVY